MLVLLDLDGTLVNTAHSRYKPMKDGLIETDVASIPLFTDVVRFIASLKTQGHAPIIVSDSHPRYVRPIAEQLFHLPYISLADKPNIKKTADYLNQNGYNRKETDSIIVVGDTWLDIELARALNVPSILTQFYIAQEVDERDGIGKAWHQLKSGPTFVAKTFRQILDILENPLGHLWAAEAVIQEHKTTNAIRLHDSKTADHLTAFRSLGRQDVGECDKYGIAVYYTEFQREGRRKSTLVKLALAIKNFLINLVSIPQFEWDYITYVSDKISTNPPNKMRDFFDLIESPITKVRAFEWGENVDGSIRNKANYRERRAFIAQNLHIVPGIDLNGKSVIVIDDQFTSGGTAYEVTNLLRQKGAKNVLFLTLFFMTSTVSSDRNCSRCGKPMQLKIRKSDGQKFFSCTPPQFRGNGCGQIESIPQ